MSGGVRSNLSLEISAAMGAQAYVGPSANDRDDYLTGVSGDSLLEKLDGFVGLVLFPQRRLLLVAQSQPLPLVTIMEEHAVGATEATGSREHWNVRKPAPSSPEDGLRDMFAE